MTRRHLPPRRPTRLFSILAAGWIACAGPAVAEIVDAEISPSGARIAVQREADGRRVLLVFDTAAAGPPRSIDVTEQTIDGMTWANDEVLLTRTIRKGPGETEAGAFEMTGYAGVVTAHGRVKFDDRDFAAIYALDTRTMQATQMLGAQRGVAFTGRLDRVLVAPAAAPGTIMMAAPIWEQDARFAGTYQGARGRMVSREQTVLTQAMALWRVDLATGRGEVVQRGEPDTRHWVVRPDGSAAARVDWHSASRRLSIWAYGAGAPRKILERESTPGQPLWVYGLGADGRTLDVSGAFDGRPNRTLRALDLATGDILPEDRGGAGLDVGDVVASPRASAALGVRRKPDGAVIWLDASLAALEARLAQMAGARVELDSATEDRSRAVIRLHKPGGVEWFVFDAKTNKAESLGPAAPR